MQIILDIETFALPEAGQYLEPVSAPSNYRDPAKIAAYCEEKRAELLGRCALDADLCTIVALYWETPALAGPSGPRGGYVAPDAGGCTEHDLLARFWADYEMPHMVQLVGFNILGFDLLVMLRRSQYLGIPAPSLNLDRYRTPHIDLMERLSFNGKIKAHSLDFYCRRFGIPCDDQHDGAEIDVLVKAGEWAAVSAHCRADVQKTKALAERLGYIQAVSTEVADVF